MFDQTILQLEIVAALYDSFKPLYVLMKHAAVCFINAGHKYYLRAAQELVVYV